MRNSGLDEGQTEESYQWKSNRCKMKIIYRWGILGRSWVGKLLRKFTIEFVHFVNHLVVPVGPVGPVLEDVNRERMGKDLARDQHSFAIVAVEVTPRNEVEFRVDPIQPVDEGEHSEHCRIGS